MKDYDKKQLEHGFVYAIYDEYAIDQGNQEEDFKTFLDWLESMGWMLADKIINQNHLDENEKKFEWIATCVCVWRADKCIWRDDQGDTLSDEDKPFLIYGRKLQDDGLKLIRRGYFDKDLTNKDWDRLHEYRIFLECCLLQKGSAWAYEQSVGLYEFGSNAILPPLGIKIPNLILPYATEFYNKSNYTEKPHEDYFGVLKPSALEEFKMMFDAYEGKIDKNGRRFVTAKPYELSEDLKSWSLTNSIESNKKPVLIVLAASMDCFWARAGAVFEHIYRTYKDVIDIKWIEVDVWDWLIRGDTTYNHFKPNAGLEEPGHALSYEDRARMVKKLYMTHPHCTFPALLDDMGDTIANYFHCFGGSGFSALIDIDGRLAWTSKSQGWGELFNTRPPQRGCCDQFPWITNVEQGILNILERNGSGDPTIFQKTPETRKSLSITKDKIMYLISSKIESIDRKKRILHIMGRSSVFSVIGHSADQKMYFNDPHKMTIYLPKDSKIYCRNIPVEFNFLEQGDIISGPGYKLIDELTWEATTVNVSKTNNDIEAIPELFKGTTYLFGKIIEIKYNSIIIIPNMKNGIGEKFIQEAGETLDLQAKALDNWTAHKKWLDKEDKTVIIELVKDTLIYKQGILSNISQCELDDNICIWYDGKDAGKSTIPAAIIISSK